MLGLIMIPGAHASTLTPRGAISCARLRVNPTTPDLHELYTTSPRCWMRPPTAPMLMIFRNLGQHDLQRSVCAVHHHGQAAVDRGVDVVLGVVLERTGNHIHRIVDHDVETTEAITTFLHSPVHLVPIGHIRLDRHRVHAPALRDLLRPTLQRLRRPAHQCDIRAESCETIRNGMAEAFAAAPVTRAFLPVRSITSVTR